MIVHMHLHRFCLSSPRTDVMENLRVLELHAADIAVTMVTVQFKLGHGL